MKKQKPSLEKLINNFLNATGKEKKLLLAMIKKINPSFKEPK